MAYSFSFIGLGLIGGSIAKALRASYPDCLIQAYDIDMQALELAACEHTIDRICESVDAALLSCDYLFLCAPVSHNDAILAQLAAHLPENTIITDVGSVKETTHTAIQNAGLSHCFIGGHPMAGSEKTGYAHANPLLLENAYYILTPTDTVPKQYVSCLKDIITSIGAIPLILDYRKHDYITAAVSHLPHIIAASLVNLVRDSDDRDGLMKLIAAGGFKDITRIASSSPVMWQSICLTNTENILSLLQSYIDSLQKIRDDLTARQADSLFTLFETAKEYRDAFTDGNHGPIKKEFAIHVDIPDVPGSIAKTATLLADHALSIRNIGIMHSREFQEGALRIEFYDEATRRTASLLLKENAYTIYDK